MKYIQKKHIYATLLAVAFILLLASVGYIYNSRIPTHKELFPSQKPIKKSQNINNPTMMHHTTVVSEEQFILDMIPHHQEAIDSSKEIVARGVNAEEKKLAQNIINSQSKEVEMMKWWLKERYPNSTWVANYKNMMWNLSIVSGMSLDRLYLQWMMMHHAWAVSMAEAVLQLSPRQEVVDFANSIIDVQSKEIEQMTKLMMESMPNMNHNNMWH